MKKIISTILVCSLLISLCVFNVQADDLFYGEVQKRYTDKTKESIADIDFENDYIDCSINYEKKKFPAANNPNHNWCNANTDMTKFDYGIYDDPEWANNKILEMKRFGEGHQKRLYYVLDDYLKSDFEIKFRLYVRKARNKDEGLLFELYKFAPPNNKSYVNLWINNGMIPNLDAWNNMTLKVYQTADTPYLELWAGTKKVTTKNLSEEMIENGINAFCLDIPHLASYAPTELRVDDISIECDYTAQLEELKDKLEVPGGSNGVLEDVVAEQLELPETIDGYPVEWSSENESIVSKTGAVTRRSYNQRTRLNAKISIKENVYINKQFTINVLHLAGADDATVLDEYIENVIKAENLTIEPANEITESISLPEVGPADISIDWESNNAVMSNVGAVVRPSFDGEDIEVTLTATIIKGDETRTVPITFIVLKEEDPSIMIGQAKQLIDDELLKLGVDLDKAKGADGFDVKKSMRLPKMTHENGTTVTWQTSDTKVITTEGKLARGENIQSATLTAKFNYNDIEDQTEYKFNVLPTEAAMIDLDLAEIDMSEWEELSENFELPKTGSLYGTEFVWKSSDPSLVGLEEKTAKYNATVYKPAGESDKETELTLTVEATNVTTQITRDYPVNVKKRKTTIELVSDAKDSLSFDTFKGENTSESNVIYNLSFPTSLENNITVEWSSDDEGTINEYGEVYRPYPGDPPKEVELKATIKSGYVSETRIFDLIVPAFTTTAEFEEKISNSMVFSKLSHETIGGVTSNLYLPETWYYNSTIEWTSNSEAISIVGDEGVVTRPANGSGNANVLLTAKITRGDEVYTKSFNVTILELDYQLGIVDIWSENCDDWSLGAIDFISDGGGWKKPLDENSVDRGTAAVHEDPMNPSNNVIRYYNNDPDYPSTTGLRFFLSKNYKGTIICGCKIYIPADFQDHSDTKFLLGAEGASGGIATVMFSANGKLRLSGKDAETVTENSTGSSAYYWVDTEYPMGKWIDIKYVLDRDAERYHFYINDECITANGRVKKGNLETSAVDYDSSLGIPYAYYRESRDNDYRGLTFTLYCNDRFSPSNLAYIDDLYIKEQVKFTSSQIELADAFEREFLADNNIMSLSNDLVIPTVSASGITVTTSSSNTDLILDNGKIKNLVPGAILNYTVSYDNGICVYNRVYNIKLASASDSVTDNEAVIKDVESVINGLKANYLLTGLKSDISLSATGEYGSTLTYSSSNTSVITNSGVITRGVTSSSAVFTVTATRGEVTHSQNISITVAQKDSITFGGNIVNSSSGGSVIFAEPVPTVTPTQPPQTSNDFVDVPDSHWAYDAIMYLKENGIISGNDNKEFESERSVNREEFVKMIVETIGIELIKKESAFSDVIGSAWYADYINTAVENNIVNGLGDGLFGIGQKVTRQDLAVMLYRACGAENRISEELFDDHDEIKDYAQDAVYTLRNHGIINGKTDELFAPMAEATRAEAAVMIYRMIQNNMFN